MEEKLLDQAPKAPEKSLRWFREARYGMFIHFGLYSSMGRGEWALCIDRIPFEEYRKLALRFNPRNLRIADWVGLAQKNGMRYMCLTTRHHEGFALFDTKASDFNSVNSPAKRDLVREYVDACRKARMGVGLYYSVADWGDPSFVAGPREDPKGWKRFVRVVHEQLRELMSNYGKVDYLFYDGCPSDASFWGGAEINAEIRRLQPDILISDRCGLNEDVQSAEGHIIGDPGKSWETCMTHNNSWGWNANDSAWKTTREIIIQLMTCAHNGGNYLLNVGPDGSGCIPAKSVRMLNQVGKWLERNGEAIYGTDPHPFNYADLKLSTARGTTAYIPFVLYYGPQTMVAGVGNRVKKVRILTTGRSVRFKQQGNRVFLTGLPVANPDPFLTVLAFELDGKPRGVPNPLLDNAGVKYT